LKLSSAGFTLRFDSCMCCGSTLPPINLPVY
jgi:recombinational DNA repair protein (RecF pathway)